MGINQYIRKPVAGNQGAQRLGASKLAPGGKSMVKPGPTQGMPLRNARGAAASKLLSNQEE